MNALEAALGARVVTQRALSGGDLSEVSLLTLSDGRKVVLKRARGAEAEATMIDAIRDAGCAAPEVIHAAPGLIAMTPLADGGPRTDRAWAEAGQHVARLHSARGARFGWPVDHAFGAVPIPNTATAGWPAFWAERRLLAWPDALPRDLVRRLEELARHLQDILPESPKGLLHGDLWSGNLLFGPEGFSGLIDPATSYGDPEVDLAMLTLFGHPPGAFFDAYGPLAPGWRDRRPIYQLWPALVHLRLFGAGYRPMVERLLDIALPSR